MGFFRSEPMKHGTLVLPVDQARNYIDLLGSHPRLQFEDMHTLGMHRPYRRHVQRIDQLEAGLRFLRDEIQQSSLKDEIRGGDVSGFLAHEQEYSLNSIELELGKLCSDFSELKGNLTCLLDQRNDTLEELYVAKLASAFHTPWSMGGEKFQGDKALRRFSKETKAPTRTSSTGVTRTSMAEGLLGQSFDVSSEDREDRFEATAKQRRPSWQDYGIAVGPADAGHPVLGSSLSQFGGVIDLVNQGRLQAALFRATRGNIFTHFQEIFEPIIETKTRRTVFKSAFVIYFQTAQNGQPSALQSRIKKVCEAMDAKLYTWYADPGEAEAVKPKLQQQLSDQALLLKEVERQIVLEGRRLIERVTYPDGNSLIEEWRLFCAKEKSIYATLNLFEEGRTSLRASCWYPANQEDVLRNVITHYNESRADASACAMLVTDDKLMANVQPPTYFRRTELTAVIQELGDTYGVPRYQEANPMPLTIVTFPFLFGIMYGDVGHGSMLFVAGLLLCYHEKKLKKMSPELHMARYLIAMMGFFATYVGLLYNDFFAVGLQLFNSRWESVDGEYIPKYDIENKGGLGPYPFGVDPAWHGSVNELPFMNSLKMKLSVVIGVAHMAAGLIMRCLNAIHDRSLVDFLFECIPMFVFMGCFFGFMDAQILYKWVTPIDESPGIINSMICMALGPMSVDKAPMFGPDLPNRLMVATMVSVLFMLVPKPLILYCKHSGGGGRHVAVEVDSPDSKLLDAKDSHGHDHDHFEIGEVVIHQMIETIEFTLGTVSHTASYLRLWALSLAHNQLASVFLEKTIGMAMLISFPFNGIAVYCGFTVWLVITLAILLGMDVLECSLHTLRLHWVEFNSKFYKADGYSFEPYHHGAILESLEPWGARS